MVEIPEVGGINRGAGKKSRGKGKESLSSIANDGGIWLTMTADKVGTMTGGFDNFVRAATAVRELADGAGGSIGLNLD
jgi:hypothetical protein